MKSVVVILAGGRGTRIRHLLPELPKPLAPVNGKPFLEWVIEFLSKQQLSHIIFSTGYLADQIKNFVVKKNKDGMKLQCIEETTPLGTAGGVLHALDYSNVDYDKALILNGDSLTLTDLKPLFKALLDDSVDVAMLGIKVQDAERYGTLLVNDGGCVAGFKEKQPGAGLISAGIYLFRKNILDQLPRNTNLSFEMDVFPEMLSRSIRIKVIEVEAPFIDIGTEESRGAATAFIQKNYKNFLS